MTTEHRLTRHVVASLGLAVLLAAGVSTTTRVQKADRRHDLIQWPDARFTSIQQAIDVLADGGTLRFTEPVVRIEQPLFVRGKRIVVEGAGCDELPSNRPEVRGGTHLIGPRPEGVAEFRAVRGLINFERLSAEGTPGGGTIRNLKLSGFDAGIRGAFGDEGPSGDGVVVENVCVTESGRGITWSGPASLAIKNVLIRDVSWNAASIVVAESLAMAFIFVSGVTVVNTANACLFFQNVQAVVTDSLFNFCGSSGTIVGLNSNFFIADTSIIGSHGPGIVVSGGSATIEETFISQARGFGILLHNVAHGDVADVHIKDSKAFASGPQAGLYGDAVTVVGGPANGAVWVTDSFIENGPHSGVANYGAFVSIGDLRIQCTLFHVEGEVLGTTNFVYSDLGGMKCGCPTASGACQAVSAVSAGPPGPLSATP